MNQRSVNTTLMVNLLLLSQCGLLLLVSGSVIVDLVGREVMKNR